MKEARKSVLKFLLGFLVVLIASAFLAPWIYAVFPYKFDRILRRLIMIGTILLGIWLVRERRESLGRIGLEWKEGSLKQGGSGFAFGVLLIILMTLIQWGIGVRMWKLYETDFGRWLGLFIKGFGAGILVGAIEEFFFRGFLFTVLADSWNRKGSFVLTNLIYALVHFFPKGKAVVGHAPNFVDSLRIYRALLPGSSEMLPILPAVAGLFLFGLLLSVFFMKKGSLFPCIGIHSGAIFALKLNRRFIPEISEKMTLLSGGKNLYDGIPGLVVLAAAVLLAAKYLRPAHPAENK